MEQLHTTDTYPSDMYLFDVCGFHLPIRDDRLGQALLEIGVEGYSILLLSFLLDLSDRPAPQQFQIVDPAPQNSIF